MDLAVKILKFNKKFINKKLKCGREDERTVPIELQKTSRGKPLPEKFTIQMKTKEPSLMNYFWENINIFFR